MGNIYVNRNIIGAVVGVQPFGGEGMSGTGPKAGGRHYLHRFCAETGDAPAVAGGLISGSTDASQLSSRLAALQAAQTTWASVDLAQRVAVLRRAADGADGPVAAVLRAHAQQAEHLSLIHISEPTRRS